MRAALFRGSLLTSAALIATACGSHVAPPTSAGPSASAADATAVLLCGAAVPAGTANVLFASDLSQNCRALGERGVPGATPKQGYHDADGYRVVLAAGEELTEWVRAARYSPGPPADVRIEVDAGVVSGPPDATFGMMCRFNMGLTPGNPDPKMYSFLFRPDGRYQIEYLEGQLANPRDRILLAGRGLAPRAGFNRVRVECIGKSLTLYLNGQRIASIEDDRLPAGLSGIRAQNYDDKQRSEFIFRNFIVMRP
jgi:hypothetical protein